MNMTKTDFKKRLKDWFIIQRIRLLNFMKEHKYISAFIGIFLMSCVVALVVYASNNDEYNGKVNVSASVIQKSVSSNDEVKSIKSFSTLVYDLSYSLSISDLPQDETVVRDEVIIEASFDASIDADWFVADQEANYDISEKDGKKILTVTMYQIRVGDTINKQLYLKVKNIPNNKEITTNFKIKEGTSDSFKDLGTKTVTIESQKVDLTAKIVPGSAYKSDDYSGGRYAPFGIIVGFDKSSYQSMEGLYFDENLELVLEPIQEVNGVVSQIELENSNSKYFGLYDRSSNLLNAMPHYKQDFSQYSVYNSGAVESLNKSLAGVSGVVSENKNPDLYLIGDKEISLEVGDTYTEYGVATKENGSATCKNSDSSCKRIIKDESGSEIKETEITSKEGTYTVSYEYSTQTGSTTIFRTVKVSAKTTKEVNGNVYALRGNNNMTILKGSGVSYKELGISKNGKILLNYDSVITYNDEPVTVVDESKVGEYKITYTITDDSKEELPEGGTEEPTEDENSDETGNTDNTFTLIRTVKVVDAKYTKAQTLNAKTIYAPSDGSFKTPIVYLDDEEVECTSKNNCSVKYYNPTTEEETSINNNVAGTYVAKYEIKDKNGFVLRSTNTVNIQTKYSLVIKGIKSDGSMTLYGDNFIALGSYFVTAKSNREQGITSDIIVKLKIGNVISDSVINENYSKGIKENKLTFNTDTDGSLTELSNSDFLAYGEEAILRSTFSYSSDGDDNIKTLTTTVPIGLATTTAFNPTAPFYMLEYGDAQSAEPYYINEEVKDKLTEVKYYACEMDESKAECNEGTERVYDSFATLSDDLNKNTKLKLAYLTYTLEDIKPGTKVDFRVRVGTNVGNHAGEVKLTSTSTFEEKQENGQYETKTITNTNNASVNVTAFKARTKLFVDGSEQDIIINGANINKSIWSIYPTVTLPAEKVNTNIAGIHELSEIRITITLPEGLNYVYNENYDIPTVNGKTLTYVLKGKQINEWIDPIYFETSYDINIPSGTEKEVSVLIQATSTTEIQDASTAGLRTTTRKITYQNNEIISHGLYTKNTAISKETSFDVNTKLYNNSKTDKQNLEIVTLLPYNDVSNEDSYTGSYTISNLPTGALCSTNLPTLIADNDKLVSDQEISWEDCSKYESDGYLGVTAIKVNGINLKSGQIYDQSIIITPTANKTGDVYNVNSYLIMPVTTEGASKKQVINSKKLKVEVISKQITGTVWEDFDSNGIMDTSEKKVSGVTLKLYDASTDELIKTTTSDEKGKYSLTDLEPGTYYVVAEYNTAKYGISPYQVTLDKSVTSSFTTFDDKTEEDDKETKEVDETEENEEENAEEPISVIRTENIEITDNTRAVRNINLGLALRKVYTVKLRKYVTRAITTNNLGVSTIKEYGNATLAKLDVKDISNLSIKVVYTIELENTGYYPGYIYAVKDYVPDGMEFNPDYEENVGWVMTDYGYLENDSLFNELVQAGEKKYLTVAFDIVRKEAGSFVNYAEVEDDDLQILVVGGSKSEEGDNNE